MTLTDERVRKLRKIVRRERINGTTAEQLSEELTQLCDFWLKSHERPMQPSETCDVHGCDIHTSSEYHGRSCRPRFCDIEDYGRPAEGVSDEDAESDCCMCRALSAIGPLPDNGDRTVKECLTVAPTAPPPTTANERKGE